MMIFLNQFIVYTLGKFVKKNKCGVYDSTELADFRSLVVNNLLQLLKKILWQSVIVEIYRYHKRDLEEHRLQGTGFLLYKIILLFMYYYR